MPYHDVFIYDIQISISSTIKYLTQYKQNLNLPKERLENV